MLTVHSLKKSYNLQILFENVSFSLNPGERAGLVGPNGCGKTTLLRILAGEELPSAGSVSRDPRLRIGYLHQGFEPDPAEKVVDIIGQAAGSPTALEAELSETALAMVEHPDDPSLSARYDDLLRRMEWSETGRAAEILAGLGLEGIDPNLPASRLSGGQKTRLALALVLLTDPQILLLDEPTNHLDIAMLEWLEDWLTASPCGMLIVSHDRTFLDHTVTRILDMDPQKAIVKEYAGNYSAYLEQRQVEFEKQMAEYVDQQLEIQQMKQDILRAKNQAQKTERELSHNRPNDSDVRMKGYKSYHQGRAKRVAKKAVAREKKLERYTDSDQRVERPREAWQIKMDFGETPHLGRSVIQTEALSVGYLAASPLLSDLWLSVEPGQRIAISGPNGSGKTTLLRTIAGEIPALGGELRLGPTLRLGYMTQDQSGLDPDRTALEHLTPYFPNETRARSFLAALLFHGDEPLKPAALLSYGQRARLMLALLVAQECNCLLLDEPINHLDIPSRTQFEQALSQFPGAVLAVVHDRYFIDRFAETIWWVENGRLTTQVVKVGL